MDLIYIGYTQKEIAKILKISESKISKEIKNIK
jgi:DNA-binding CsgD family transcriptional regulator